MRLLIQTTFSIFITALSISHLALAANPTTCPAQPDIKWCLDRAAQEVPNLALKPGPFPQAIVRARCYADLADAYLDAKEPTSAQKMIEAAMQQYSLMPASKDDFGSPANEIIRLMCKTKNFDGAQRLADQIQGTSRDFAYSEIAHALAYADQIEAAIVAAEKISTTARFADMSRTSAFQCIAAAYLRAGNPAAAKAILENKKKLTDYNLAIAHLVAGDIAAAEALLPNIDDPQQKITVLRKAAYMQGKRKNRAEAIRLLDASEAAAAGIHPSDPRVFLNNVTSRMSIDDKEGARKDLQFATAALDPNKKPLERAHDAIGIASAHAETGDSQQALRLLAGINLSELRDSQLACLKQEMAQSAQFRVGIDFSSLVDSQLDWIKQEIAVQTAEVHARSGDLPSAKAAMPGGQGANNPSVGQSDIRPIASAAASAGKLNELKQWAQQSTSPEERFAIYLGAAAGLTSKP